MGQFMNAGDAVHGSLAKCYVTIEGKRYNFMQLIDFEAVVDKKKTEIPILGQTGKGHKACGWKGTFRGRAHYNQPVLRQYLAEYKKTGRDVYFDIEVTNDDGLRQVVVLKDCCTDGGVLAKFDVNAQFLEEGITGTFDDFEIRTAFRVIDGMRVN